MPDRKKDSGWIYRILDYYPGVENIRQYRDDVRKIVLEKSDRFQNWNPDIDETKMAAQQSAADARDSYWDKISLFLSIGSAAFAIIPPLEVLLGTFSIFISILLFIRRATVEVLLYDLAYRFRAPENVKFAYAWNSGMNGWTSLLLIPMGVFVKLDPDGYRIVLWLVDDVVGEKF